MIDKPQRAVLLSADPSSPRASSRLSLQLTPRWLAIVRNLCLKEKRRRERMILKHPDFIPEPGRFDKNKNMVEVMNDIVAILNTVLQHHDEQNPRQPKEIDDHEG